MKTSCKLLWALLFLACAAAPVAAGIQPKFSGVVTFGDSLSDSGNVFAASGMQSVPPYAGIDPQIRVPTFPYATGGHHFSNGRTWIELLARDLRLVRDAGPALRVNGASNYAFGGARGCDSASNPFDLGEQVDLFLASGGAARLDDRLVVIFVGGNDVRADLETGGTGAIIACAVAGIVDGIQRLAAAGADRFLVANVPNIGATPAIRAIGEPAVTGATLLSSLFNSFLDPQLAGLDAALGIQIARFDVAGALAAASGGDRFAVIDRACITPGQPPFRCGGADDFLFWDGIHPTAAGHEVLKDQALSDLESAVPPLADTGS